jgi:hypothetical protein
MTNNKQQTAVEWLWEIAYNRELTIEDWKQAKEMEKERMIQFCIDWFISREMNIREYYEQTYGGGKQ